MTRRNRKAVVGADLDQENVEQAVVEQAAELAVAAAAAADAEVDDVDTEEEAKEAKPEPTEPQVGTGMWTTPRAEATKVEKVGFCIRKRETGLYAPFASCMNGKGWNIRSDRFATLEEAQKRAAENAERAGYRLGEWEETKGGAVRAWLTPVEAEA